MAASRQQVLSWLIDPVMAPNHFRSYAVPPFFELDVVINNIIDLYRKVLATPHGNHAHMLELLDEFIVLDTHVEHQFDNRVEADLVCMLVLVVIEINARAHYTLWSWYDTHYLWIERPGGA